MITPPKTPMKTRIARRAASLVAASLITFTGLHLIASYALPPVLDEGVFTLASVSDAAAANPAAEAK